MKRNIIVIPILLALINWGCTRIDQADISHDLKRTLETNSHSVRIAMEDISTSQAYQVITVNGVSEKAEEGYADSITLDLISGIYEYNPNTAHFCRYQNNYELFKRTGDSDSLIVKLPGKFIFHPSDLHERPKCDSVIKNNFEIAASDYHCYYSLWHSYDYKLKAGFTLDSADIGSLSILTKGESYYNQSYSSAYEFPEDYKITTYYQTGDSLKKEFALFDGDNLLLKETILFIKSGYRYSERQYTLSIGNIDIKKSTGIDSIQVFLDGVLQKTAAAVIVDSTDNEHSICHHRDILLTFDDGTTATLSELIGPAISQLRELVDSLRSMTFAKRVVDYIAFNIYYSRRWY